MTIHMRVTYADGECCEAARQGDSQAWEITRTDSTGSVTYVTCTEHRDDSAASQSRYVSGWGDVTLTIVKVQVEGTLGTHLHETDTPGVRCPARFGGCQVHTDLHTLREDCIGFQTA